MIGQRLKSMRGSRTQQEIADKLGVSRARYSHYETGRVEPDNDLLAKMATVLNCTSDYLIGKSDEPTLTESQYNEALVEYEDLIKELEPLTPEERKRRIQRLRDFAKGMSESD